MFSIIICSNNKRNWLSLKSNIEETSAFQNEIIVYENPEGLGLCHVYNLVAAQAKNKYLCFAHDDLWFHTKGWDKKIAEQLQMADTGFVGLMGGTYKSYFGVSWNDGEISSHRYNIKNGAHGGNHLLENPGKKRAEEVICLDGAFLCCKKTTWAQNQFDAQTFRGFHFYDLDVCLQAHTAGLKNYVVYDVLLEHFSEGRKEAALLADYLRFKEKWAQHLPLSLNKKTATQKENLEGYSLAETLELMKKNRFSSTQRWQLLQKYWNTYRNKYHFLRSAYFGFIR